MAPKGIFGNLPENIISVRSEGSLLRTVSPNFTDGLTPLMIKCYINKV